MPWSKAKVDHQNIANQVEDQREDKQNAQMDPEKNVDMLDLDPMFSSDLEPPNMRTGRFFSWKDESERRTRRTVCSHAAQARTLLDRKAV